MFSIERGLDMKKKILLACMMVGMLALSACGDDSDDKKKDKDNDVQIEIDEQEDKTTEEKTTEEITEEVTTEATTEEVTEEPEEVLSDEPMAVPENPGTEDNFVFEMNGTKYEFKSTDTVKLYHYSQTFEGNADYGDQIVGLLKIYDGKGIRLSGMTMRGIEERRPDCDVVYDDGTTSVLKWNQEDGSYAYYVVFGDFAFGVLDFLFLEEEGYNMDDVFAAISDVHATITETSADNNMSTVYDGIMAREVVPGYRFAFRPSSQVYGQLWENDGNGILEYNLDYERIDYSMIQPCGAGINLEYNCSATDAYYYAPDEDCVDTGLTFAGYKLYEDTDAYEKTYVLFMPELISRIDITVSGSLEVEFNAETAIGALEEAFVPVE